MASDMTKQSRLDMLCLECDANLLLPFTHAWEAANRIQ